MVGPTEQLNGIEYKIGMLAKKIVSLQRENAILSEENKRLKAVLQDTEKKLRLAVKNNNGQTQPEEESKKVEETAARMQQIKEELAQYLQEIDKCIAVLNS